MNQCRVPKLEMAVFGVFGKELVMVKGMKLRRILDRLFLSELISSPLGCNFFHSLLFSCLECLTQSYGGVLFVYFVPFHLLQF